MAIFLKNSWNVPPARWGSFEDVQYAIWTNLEKIYGVDPETELFILPMFWGFPVHNYSISNYLRVNYGVLNKDRSYVFGGDDYIYFGDILDVGLSDWTISTLLKTNQGDVFSGIIGKHKYAGIMGRYGLFTTTVSPNKVRSLLDFDAVNVKFCTSTSNINDGIKHSIYATYDRDGLMSLYFDGDIEDTDDISAYSSVNIQSALNFDIGVYRNVLNNPANYFTGNIYEVRVSNAVRTAEQISLFNALPYGLYQKVQRPFHLLPIALGPFTRFSDLDSEILAGSESLQDLTTDIQTEAETFFDLQTEISATTVQTILDLDTEIAADYNLSFEDLNTDIQAVAELIIDLNTDISAVAPTETIIGLDTDIRAASDIVYYDLDTDIQIRNGATFYDLNTEISVIRSKYWLDTEIEAASYARWSFNTEWNPNRFLNTEIAAKKPYTFSFKTKTGSSYVASSSEIEILLSGYSWPLRTLFLDYLRVGTSNVYNFELWWSRGRSGKNPLKEAKIKAEYTNTSYAGGYEVVSCDWLSIKIDGGASQTVNATPLDLGDMPCDSKLDVELTVECRDCSLTRGLVFFRLIVTGDYKEAIYGAPVVYGDGTQYFEGSQDDYESNNFIARLYVVG